MSSRLYGSRAATIWPPHLGQTMRSGASLGFSLHWVWQLRQDMFMVSTSRRFFSAIRMLWSARWGMISSRECCSPARPMAVSPITWKDISPLSMRLIAATVPSTSKSSHSTRLDRLLEQGGVLERLGQAGEVHLPVVGVLLDRPELLGHVDEAVSKV